MHCGRRRYAGDRRGRIIVERSTKKGAVRHPFFVEERLDLSEQLSPDGRATTRRATCGVTSFSFKKEVTKKVNPDVPSGPSLSVPRYKAQQERSNVLLICSASTLATTRAGVESKDSCFLVGRGQARNPKSSTALAFGNPTRSRRPFCAAFILCCGPPGTSVPTGKAKAFALK